MPASERRAPRADARANRERLLDAAGALFAERGVDAPMNAIAQRAGVGVGTAYRHFADRDALVLGLADRVGSAYEGVIGAAAGAASGWEAIVAYVDGVTAMYIDLPYMVAIRSYERRLRPPDPRWEPAARAVIARAWAEGSLRPDVDATDLAFVPSLLSGLVDLPEPLRSIVMRRERDIILDGLRADGVPRSEPGGPPLGVAEFRTHVGEPGTAP